jgi:uncharacterized protein YcsI (UPF0317 family)
MHTTDMAHPVEARRRIRAGAWTRPTAGFAPGYVQANLVVLPRELADDFEGYCRANPKALPLLERTEPGSPVPRQLAPDADLRTDLPRYRLYRDGRLVEEPTDIVTLWRSDYVAFLIGCSFSFDAVLLAQGVSLSHVAPGRNVAMYVTDRATAPRGPFAGPLVVSLRMIPASAVPRAIELTRRLPSAHGAPLQVGSPEALGIADLARPDYGDPPDPEPDRAPVFWPCGVTSQAAAVHGRIPLMITHAPGHMLITDRRVRLPAP